MIVPRAPSYPEGFSWSQEAHRYRNKKDGRFVAERTILKGRDAFISRQVEIVNNLTSSLLDGGMTLSAWETAMKDRIRTAHTAEFLFGRGGKNAITDADKQAARKVIREQRLFLRSFTESIRQGDLSEKQIRARARMYARSSTQSFERGRARAWNVRLPAYPADGSAECLSNDRCHWRYGDKPDAVLAYWTLGAGEHCGTCLDRSRRWNPYRVEKT